MSRNGQPAVVVHTFAMPARLTFDLHTHDSHQLATSAGGVLTVGALDRTWILPPNRALWIPAGLPHTTAASSASLLRTAYIDAAGCPVRWAEPTPVAADDVLHALVSRLGNATLPTAQRKRTLAVLYDVLAPVQVTTVATRMPTDPRAAAVADALLTDPADPRDLTQWGRHVGASARTLARGFADTGLTFARWRTAARVAAALELLAAGEPVSRVAGRVGYESVSAFVAAFSRELGTTPAQYFR